MGSPGGAANYICRL